MIYLIDIDSLLINIRKTYKELLLIIDKSLLDDFINNCAVNSDNMLYVNIDCMNNFRHIYSNEFKYIMQLTKQRAV